MFICSPVREPLVPEARSPDQVRFASLRWNPQFRAKVRAILERSPTLPQISGYHKGNIAVSPWAAAVQDISSSKCSRNR